MKKIIIFLIVYFLPNIFSYSIDEINLPNNFNKSTIYFIKCGSSDSILIESNGHFGLVDSSKPYKYIENEVEHVQINESIGEKDHTVTDPDKSVQAVINYMNYLNIHKIRFYYRYPFSL